VDDLKPWIAAYGDKHAKTPGMDRLAREGIVFQNSYCQQATCASSRASLLSGMRPDKTRVWDSQTVLRQVNPKIVTMPQYFKSMGYETAGVGKIFLKESVGQGNDAPSWSIPYRDPKCPTYFLSGEVNAPGKWKATECANVPDNTYHDGKLTAMAIQLMDSLSLGDKPFFLAVGFSKPNLPFVVPKKYWDLYNRNEFEVAAFQKKAKSSPDFAYQPSSELKSYADIQKFDSYSAKEFDHLSMASQKELIHGYYAAVSYVDAQIVQLMSELDRLDIRKNTILILLGDHGRHLGDHGLWDSNSNFEQATHSLLMMSIPGKKAGVKPVATSEFVDIFPTLCHLTNVPVPPYLDGISLVPAIDRPESEIKGYALSQSPAGKDVMGYSIRTKRFRYTEWLSSSYRTYLPYNAKYVAGREMYDYEKDPLETENILDKPEYKKDQEKMTQMFQDCIKREYAGCLEFSKLADYKNAVNTEKKTAKGIEKN
jgi:arylsulfatase A-like enzyme